METKSRKYKVVPLSGAYMDWFVNTAAVRMLEEEVKRPRLVDRTQIEKLATQGMYDGTAFVGLVDDEPVGAIGGLLLPHTLKPSILVLYEVFWYVLPSHRQSKMGLMLLASFVKKGECCADEITMSLLPGSPLANQALVKRGFSLAEQAFHKEVV